MSKKKVIVHKSYLGYKETIREWWWDSYIYTAYRYITRIFPERLGRSISYFVKGWHNYDFDNHYVNELVLFKLRRLRHCFERYGHHSPDCPNYPPKVKSLNLAIKLLERICEANYHRFLDLHDKKWGETEFKFVSEGNHYIMETKVEKADTPELKQQEQNERMEAYKKDERMEARDLRIAYAIIGKYQKYWWD